MTLNYKILFILFISSNTYCSFENFDDLMRIMHKNYDNDLRNKNLNNMIEIVKKQYSAFTEIANSSKVGKIADSKIPKIIHQIWINNKPVPRLYEKFRQSWKNVHPDWQYKLWLKEDIEKLGLENKYYYDKTRDNREKADIARYEILFRFGGVYADLDCECIKSFDVFHESCDFYTGIQHYRPISHLLANGLIGAKQGHPIIKECIESIKISSDKSSIHDRTGPLLFTNAYFKTIANCNGINLVLPSVFFYSMPFGTHYNQNSNQYIRKESYSIHYWGNFNHLASRNFEKLYLKYILGNVTND